MTISENSIKGKIKSTHIAKFFREMTPLQRQVAKEYIAKQCGISVAEIDRFINGRALPETDDLRKKLNQVTGRDLKFGTIKPKNNN